MENCAKYVNEWYGIEKYTESQYVLGGYLIDITCIKKDTLKKNRLLEHCRKNPEQNSQLGKILTEQMQATYFDRLCQKLRFHKTKAKRI